MHIWTQLRLANGFTTDSRLKLNATSQIAAVLVRQTDGEFGDRPYI